MSEIAEQNHGTFVLTFIGKRLDGKWRKLIDRSPQMIGDEVLGKGLSDAFPGIEGFRKTKKRVFERQKTALAAKPRRGD